MNKSNDNNSLEIDEIEIVDLSIDEEPGANGLTDKGQNVSRPSNRTEWHSKRWRRGGMTAIIFGGCLALCLILWPDIAGMFPITSSQQVTTPGPTIWDQRMARDPLLTKVFVFGDTAYISTYIYTQPFATNVSDGTALWDYEEKL